ncbi:hypothetical protein ONS95_012330 [Cadophora gregata]|uniref:uncharacterized protein n=1 Tax=Cadophora gregata TaxID=51156 RepID=UPI0026DC1B2C|nr:uncharacterized protein ONS95_012330 [Cadophora gregata]KAK0118019.1 hypothetical protein ONS95_012330 [Cadophora gregata]KAK0123085.1 hypothetical protein ONS96_010093 [Cadophora gregata f. sp. sojae]
MMPQTAGRPEDVGASAIAAAQEMREQHQHHQQESDLKQNQQNQASTISTSSISIPSLILTALFIRQVLDTSTIQRTVELFFRQYCMNATTFYCGLIDWVFGHVHLIMLILQSTATFSAFAWLLYRAYRTLRTPVSNLIDTLGVEVPDPPEVTLAGLKSNACTLHWRKPGPGTQKAVAKYLIQVNGVNVGESLRSETVIEITGLKPGHFYNVRVIAVGANHFQAGSKVLRLSTLCKDGRPQQGHSGPPSTQDEDDQDSDGDSEAQAGRGHGVEIQAATLPESAQISMVRENSGGHSGGGGQAGQRRNTGGRKHSPSTAAADQAARERAIANVSEGDESMQQLTEKFEANRKQTEDTQATITKETEEYKILLSELSKERDAKKQEVKDKEEQSEKLKKEVNNSERLNRLAQNKKSQREKVLKEKKAEREKMRDDMARWKQEIETMRSEKENWRVEKEKLAKSKEEEVSTIQKQAAEQQLTLESLEKEIHVRGRQIMELEGERNKLPGSENDEESQARDAADKKEEAEWQAKERALVSRLNSSSQRLRDIEIMITQQQAHLTALEAAHRAAQPPLMFLGNSSGVDFDPSGGQGKAKPRRTRNRKSRTNTISSPISAYPIVDSQFPSASVYNNLGSATSPSFAPPPYIQMNNDTGMVIQADHMSGMSDDEIRILTAGAPLSPTATSLLPSNIFADDDHDDNDGRAPSFGPAMYGNIGESIDKDPQSPDSSSRSASLISSPHNSSHNLALYGVASHDYVKDSERRSIKSPLSGFGTIGSPSTEVPVTKGGLMNLFTLPRARGKAIQEDGPALGSLKHGQSQSFPRSAEEPESLNPKHRRISFSTASWGFFKGSPATETSAQGNAPAPARNVGARNRRGFPIFSNSVDEPNHRSERDPSSPRPLSIASSDLPRPSTDSAPFGWTIPSQDAINRGSPLGANWSVHHVAPQTWSRNPSRRPSIQHGSSSALTTGIASDDDEFLPSSESFAGQASPPPVGVIGTRPVSSHKPPTPKLNPAAPAFSQRFGLPFTSKVDKGKGKAKTENIPTSPDNPPPHDGSTLSSPTASRKSRDAHSIRTQNSMAESHESLDRAASNTTSEFPSGSSAKEKDGNALGRLLRKGSSSKFSIASFRSKENGLFSGKKGVSSTPNSDRGLGEHRDSSMDEFGEDVALGRSVDSVTSSPMIGSMGSGEWKGKDKELGTPKESRMNWFGLKKGKGKESSEVEGSEADLTDAQA